MDMAGLLGRLFRRQRTPELRCSAVVPAAGTIGVASYRYLKSFVVYSKVL